MAQSDLASDEIVSENEKLKGELDSLKTEKAT